MTIRGRVSNGVVLLPTGAELPEGTVVDVTPLGPSRALPGEAAPPYRVSTEQHDALLGLIGMWTSNHPPSDDEVDRMIDEYRTRKHG